MIWSKCQHIVLYFSVCTFWRFNWYSFTRLYMFPLFFWQIFAYNWYSKLLRQAIVRKIYHPSLPVWSWLITSTKYLQSSKIPSFNLNKASSLVTASISTPFAYNWYKQTVETLKREIHGASLMRWLPKLKYYTVIIYLDNHIWCSCIWSFIDKVV